MTAVKFGNYEILRKLGAGGMAEVLLAKQVGIDGFERLVCLKRILPHLSTQQDFIDMFRDEARIAAQLTHPNIAQIYDINQAEGMYYIAMEYIRGEDLRRIYNQEVKRGRAMPQTYAAQMMMGAAAGLDYAHRQVDINGRPLGLVHRDISPQNLLVNYDGHVKIVDFGVAKAAGKMAQTRSGVLKGKYSYMSPEQASGDPVDSRSDIFALGTTLYEITTGTRLFKRENEIETLQAVIACQVKLPSSVLAGYDTALEAIIMRALEREPDDRYQTAAEMERDLEGYLRSRGHGTSASLLAEYMHDLFADKLADEALFGGAPWEEPNTQKRESGPSDPVEYDNKVEATRRINVAAKAKDLAFEPTHIVDVENEQSQTEVRPRQAPMQAEATEADAAAFVPPTTKRHEWSGGHSNDWDEQTNADEVTQFSSTAEELRGDAPLLSSDLSPDGPAKSKSSASKSTSKPAAKRRSKKSSQGDFQTPRWALTLLAIGVVLVLAIALGIRQAKRPHDGEATRTETPAPPIQREKPVQKPEAPTPPAEVAPAPTPEPTPPPVVVEPPPLPKEPEVKPAERPAPIVALRDPAYLTVISTIPVEVWSGSDRIGQTPLLSHPIPAGVHRLKFENAAEGYLLRRKIRVAKAEHHRISLPTAQGTLIAQATPWAWVKIGDKPAVETPATITLYEGEYDVVFECPDGRRKKQSARITAAHTVTIAIECRL